MGKFPLPLLAGMFSWVGCLTMYWFYLQKTGVGELNVKFAAMFYLLGGILFLFSAASLEFPQWLGFKSNETDR